MCSEGHYDYERLGRERVSSRSHPRDGHHKVVHDGSKRSPRPDKRPPRLDKRPPLLHKRPPLVAIPHEGYSRYYSHCDCRVCNEGRHFSHYRRSGPSHRGDEFDYRWARDHHSTSRQSDYRDMRDGYRRRSYYSSHHSRDRSPHRRDAPYFRESRVGRKDSPHSGRYSPKRSRTHSVHQSQHRRKERDIQSLKTSRDTSFSRSSAVSSFKALDKPSRLTEKELAAAERKWASITQKKSDEKKMAENSEFEVGSAAPLFIEQTEEPESNTAEGTEMYEDSQLSDRSKAIDSKTKEIEQVYRQDCETFGMVVKMLIEKDPSLEESIQFSLRENLREIGERCVEELKHFITEYDNSTQDCGDPVEKK